MFAIAASACKLHSICWHAVRGCRHFQGQHVVALSTRPSLGLRFRSQGSDRGQCAAALTRFVELGEPMLTPIERPD